MENKGNKGFLRNLWNRIIEAITGKSTTQQLESGDEQKGVLKEIEQLQNDVIETREDSHENDFKTELAKKTPFQGFKKPMESDLSEKSGEKELEEKTPHNPSNGEVSTPENNQGNRIKGTLPVKKEKIIKGDLFNNNSSQETNTENSPQEASTENSPQETSSFKGFKKPEEIADSDDFVQ